MRGWHSARKFLARPRSRRTAPKAAARRPQRINARADALLRQIPRLVVERLRQFHTRFGRLHVRAGPQATQVLRHHQQHNLLARGLAVGAVGAHALARGLPAPPQCQIKNWHPELRTRLKKLEWSEVLRESGDRNFRAKVCFQVTAPPRVLSIE